MTANEVAAVVVDASYHIHVKLGPGLLESVYLRVLEYELNKRGLNVLREVAVKFRYDNLEFDEGFRADRERHPDRRIEIRRTDGTRSQKQLLTYLKLTGKPLGLLINFGAPLIKDGITRLVNGLKDRE